MARAADNPSPKRTGRDVATDALRSRNGYVILPVFVVPKALWQKGSGAMQVWPAIDIRGGKCVRLLQGDYDRETIFASDPVDMAVRWVEAGAQCLHLVDLDGAREGRLVNGGVVSQIMQAIDVPCQFGGGVRSEKSIGQLLEMGFQRVVVGTRALKDPQWLRESANRFPGRVALGIDARDGRVATDGWLETSSVAAVELAAVFAYDPIAAVIYTDISKDGMMAGPNVPAVVEMKRAVSVPLIASGGIAEAAHVEQLARAGVDGCIIGRALYEGKLTLADAMAAAVTAS